MGNALREARPASRERGKNLLTEKVPVKAQFPIARILHRGEREGLRGGFEARSRFGQPGPQKPPLT